MQRFLPSGNTINRAYASPTCSLEVWAKRSPMSAWTSQTVVQNLRFRLRLAQGKVIKGNQSQINRIIEAVIAYSDRWLAQETVDKLDHAIAIPQGANLQLSTLQLFDLYETLEQCSRELVILPDVVLEVRRITPNWLKIMAAAIAIIGVSIGAVRLVSRDQPSLQIASTPNPLPPEIAPPAISDRQNPTNNLDQNLPQAAPSPSRQELEQSSSQSSPPSKSPSLENYTSRSSEPQLSRKPAPSSPKLDPETKSSIALESAPTTPIPEGFSDRAISPSIQPSSPPNLQPNLPSGIGAARQESPIAKPMPAPSALANGQTGAIPDASDALPSIASSRSAPSSRSPKLPSAKLQIANVQSQLPEIIQTDLVKYIANYLDQQAIVLSRDYVIEMQVTGDRVQSITVTPTTTNISDQKSLQQLQQAIKAWRSASPVNGSMRIELRP